MPERIAGPAPFIREEPWGYEPTYEHHTPIDGHGELVGPKAQFPDPTRPRVIVGEPSIPQQAPHGQIYEVVNLSGSRMQFDQRTSTEAERRAYEESR
jgi:hypothetical protein